MKSSVVRELVPRIDIEGLEGLEFGRLLVDVKTNQIYTKDIYGSIVETGNSPRTLIEFEDYYVNEISMGVLQFMYDSYGILRLGLSIPRFSLRNIYGVDIPISINKSYLGFNSNLDIESKQSLSFSMSELADIKNFTTLDKNNWVLTYSPTSQPVKYLRDGSQTVKDKLGKPIYGGWELRPEMSTIRAFDDAGRAVEADKQIYRIPKPNEQRSYRYINHPLPIIYDDKPCLSNNLDSDSLSIYNVGYLSNSINCSSNVSTVTIDFTHSFTVIKPSDNVKLLVLDIIAPSPLIPSMYIKGLIIQNYKGRVELSGGYLENGIEPISLDGDLLLSLIFTSHPSARIQLVQKTLNMR